MTEAAAAGGLGLDAGGTATRWALADMNGNVVTNGKAKGLTALQMSNDAGRSHIRDTLTSIKREFPDGVGPSQICAGVTGHTEGGDALRALIADSFSVDIADVSLRSDIEIAYLDLFEPGEGIVIYAGTGTIAAFIDRDGVFHRSGGRGALVDDAGGGYWIAVEALRYIWREEDVKPGSWRESPLANELFKRIGGSEWAMSRQFIYQRERGEIGTLALAVAAAARNDDVALQIFQRAGIELARLGNALLTRFGNRRVVLAGRAATLHPAIEKSLRETLPPSTDLQIRQVDAHFAAARIAAKSAASAAIK